MRDLRRKAGLVLRLALPTRAERACVAEIRQSGLFDRAYYRASHPYLNPLHRAWPERHYVQFGERAGLRPNPAFSPQAYLRHLADPPRDGRALLHYIRAGRTGVTEEPDGAWHLTPLAGTDRAPAAPAAIVAHVFYRDLWPELAAAIARQGIAADLFVTVTAHPAGDERMARAITGQFPQARVWSVPNRGRDVLPFLGLLATGALAEYRAVAKIHGKKSPLRTDGDAWRARLVDGILGDSRVTERALERFLADRSAGLWVADGQRQGGARLWRMNRPRTEALLAAIGIATDADLAPFPAGSIYWAKPQVLEALRRLHPGPDGFEPERGQADGTTAHAVERATGQIARAQGLRVVETSELLTP